MWPMGCGLGCCRPGYAIAYEARSIVETVRINPGQKFQLIVWRVECITEDMTEMLRNNPPDVVYAAFHVAFFQGAIRMFQRDNEMRNIVLTDAAARDKSTWHFFNRALREVRELREYPMKLDTGNAY